MDYYEFELPYLTIRRDKNGKVNLSSKIMLTDIDEYIKWRDMPRPFEMHQRVEIVTGYHTGRRGTICGIKGNVLWVHIDETGKMAEIYSSTVRHI